ncbi:MAG TPA: serpin family protein [Polyangiaceae bacterium]|nr:serpin family protein [Polyangiaceae bacterium]
MRSLGLVLGLSLSLIACRTREHPAPRLPSGVDAPRGAGAPSASVPTSPSNATSAARPSGTPAPTSAAPPALPPEPPADSVARDAAGARRFAVELTRELASHSKQNLFVSPASIRTALGMAWLGAAGTTRDEMERVLHYEDRGATSAVLRWVLARWRARGAGASPNAPRDVLRVVNHAWGRKGLPFLGSYRDALATTYEAPLEELDFAMAPAASRAAINDWVNGATEGKISDLVPDGAITSDAALVLTSAVYFKASWRNPFPVEGTQDGAFASVPTPVPFMSRTGDLSYAKVPGAAIVELPYAGGDQAMLVVLPDAKDGLGAFVRALGPTALDGFVAALRPARVHVTLPRFSAGSATSLAAPLAALGMKRAFDAKQADFSGIDGRRDVFVSAAVHQAVVTVDEHGTEAAGATALTMSLTSLRVGPIVEFRVDHPFLFVIRDVALGHALFVGLVTNPGSATQG